MPINREEWLQNAVEALRPRFKEAKYEIPAVIRVSCGFPSKGALSKNKRLGEAWESRAAKDGIHQVFISPFLSDSLKVLDILVHELLHCALPDNVGHKKPFKVAAKALGLEGPATSTTAGEELTNFYNLL